MADGSHAAVVALVGGAGVMCSGLLVSRRVVLTAAHCVEDGALPSAVFGEDPQAGARVQSIDSRAHPDFDPSTHEHDVGVLLLEEDAPVEPAVPGVAALDPSWVGRDVVLFGYGLTSATGSEPPLRRSGVARVVDLVEGTIVLEPAPATACGGDSGGPVFSALEGDGALVGVIASGDAGCGSFTRVARLDASWAFVAAYVEATAPGSALPGERCFYDENCAQGPCRPALDDPRLKFCSPACETSAECAQGLECIEAADGRACRHPCPSPGALGSACLAAGDCASGVCARREGDDAATCSERCFPDWAGTCPEGTVCLGDADAPGEFACFADERKPGCQVAGGAEAPGCRALLLWGLVVLGGKRGRRRRG